MAAPALSAGVRAIQFREKDLSAREAHLLAGELLALAREAGASLLINDRIDIAMALGAEGVHLSGGSLPAGVARSLLGPRRLIGVSCHSPGEVRQAQVAGADFAVLGPIYETPSKARFGPPLAPRALRIARGAASIPILAIGGIRPDRVEEVMEAGADGIAVISAVLGAPDPGAAAADLLAAVAACR